MNSITPRRGMAKARKAISKRALAQVSMKQRRSICEDPLILMVVILISWTSMALRLDLAKYLLQTLFREDLVSLKVLCLLVSAPPSRTSHK